MKRTALDRRKAFFRSLVAVLTAAALASCGGGSGGQAEGPPSPAPSPVPLPSITLLAGNASASGHQDGAGVNALFGAVSPSTKVGLALATSGELLIGDIGNRAIRSFTPDTGMVSTLAEQLSADASFAPMATAPDGSLYFPGSRAIYRVAPDGTVSVAAGEREVCGDVDRPFTQDRLCWPDEMAFDHAGNLYFTHYDSRTTVVRKIDQQAGQVSTVATVEGSFQAFVVERDGSLLLARNRSLERHRPDGTVLVIGTPSLEMAESRDGPASEALLQQVLDVTLDAQGRVFVLEAMYRQPTQGSDPNQVSPREYFSIRQINDQGNVSTVGRWNTTVDRSQASGLVAHPSGSFYVAETWDSSMWITKVNRDGTSQVVAGKAAHSPVNGGHDGVASEASLPYLSSLALAPSGQWLLGSSHDGASYLRTVNPQGKVQRVAYTWQVPKTVAHSPAWRAVVADKAGNIFTNTLAYATTNGGAQRDNRALIFRVSPEGILESWLDLSDWISPFSYRGTTHFFRAPISGMTMDDAGMLYVAGVNGVLLKVSPNKEVTLLAGKPGALGHTDGSAEQARFSILGNLALDCKGNLLALDGLRDDLTGIGPTVRKITPEGTVSTLAGDADNALGLTDGAAGEARFSFAKPAAWVVQSGGPFGLGSTFITVGEDFLLGESAHLASDQSCNVYLTDPTHHVIRRVSSVGRVETVLGQPGRPGFLASPLPGAIHTPTGIAVQGNRLFFTMRDALAYVDLP